jgi:hypothetical protein
MVEIVKTATPIVLLGVFSTIKTANPPTNSTTEKTIMLPKRSD